MGVDHQPWFWDTVFSRKLLANISNPVPIHAYSKFIGIADIYGQMSDVSKHTIEYCIELTRAFMDDPNNVWVQEVGACRNNFVSDQEQCEFMMDTLGYATACKNIWGITLWSSHGVNMDYPEFHQDEKTLRVLDSCNKPLPLGESLRTFISGYKKDPIIPIKKTKAFVINDDTYSNLSKTPTNVWPEIPKLDLLNEYLNYVDGENYQKQIEGHQSSSIPSVFSILPASWNVQFC